MYASIQIHDLRGATHGFVCSCDREDWRIFLEALDTDDGERLMRALGVEGHARIAVLGSIVIHEDFRGRNIGATMFRQFLQVAKADAVIVAATPPSRCFFQAMGFVPCGDTGLMLMKPAERYAHPLRQAA
ncbi:MAG TPA: GNAT family N-acetyltransferase [Rhodocyclaceae bacterium]